MAKRIGYNVEINGELFSMPESSSFEQFSKTIRMANRATSGEAVSGRAIHHVIWRDGEEVITETFPGDLVKGSIQ